MRQIAVKNVTFPLHGKKRRLYGGMTAGAIVLSSIERHTREIDSRTLAEDID